MSPTSFHPPLQQRPCSANPVLPPFPPSFCVPPSSLSSSLHPRFVILLISAFDLWQVISFGSFLSFVDNPAGSSTLRLGRSSTPRSAGTDPWADRSCLVASMYELACLRPLTSIPLLTRVPPLHILAVEPSDWIRLTNLTLVSL
ncbi:hypothetical protein C8R45DRAFT_1208975 [Mycena sanguinolenta]|nr:hypothetical protein C8R45DRAFT_1208975 [Mycena sanguinolenta]